ncbi:MAG: hypothetical protein QUT30_13095 [Acidobacteriota bacterium]|jgi:hypothetical protein|nr:hypothetical protein [Acidobacteriota bacterium]
MAEGMNPYDEDVPPEETRPAGKAALVNAAILAAIFALSILLPPEYKAFVPFLFLIPLVLAVVAKVRQIRKKNEDSPHMPDADHTIEPYSYTPKDPNDPRRYKPIG